MTQEEQYELFEQEAVRSTNNQTVLFEKPQTLTAQRRNDPALRYDKGKLRYDLLPADGIEALARVYTVGAQKYADRNWEQGMSWSRMLGSLFRHTWKFVSGERYDPETGCHHMAMAAWNAIGLCVYDMRAVGSNDFPSVPAKNHAWVDTLKE